jgi:hypothetical protein
MRGGSDVAGTVVCATPVEGFVVVVALEADARSSSSIVVVVVGLGPLEDSGDVVDVGATVVGATVDVVDGS